LSVKKRGGADVYTFRFTSLYPPATLAKKLNAALLFGSANAWTNRFAIVLDIATQKQVFDMEKETNIIIRLKPNDKEEIKKKASSAGLTLSEYARKLLLSGEIIKVEPEDRLTLNGIANNLNQLTRLANQTKAIQPETENVLRNLINQIRHAYRKR
jgi:hypothetical protein